MNPPATQQNSNSAGSCERCNCESSAVQDALRVLQQFVACHAQESIQQVPVDQSETTVGDPTSSKPIASKPTTVKTEQNKTFLTPEEVRGLPNTRSTKQVGKRRAKGRSMIATDTPERNDIAAKQAKIKRVVKIEPDDSVSSAKPVRKSKRRIADEFAG